ncbi:MAG: HlyC/CorC family transporter [Verrucomicrobia bacterium]|nr:HlyC/CorC family transporter [Verrucomicrobiota bacterium]
MPEFLEIIAEALVVLLLVFANGFFVAAEFALVKVRSSQLYPLEKEGGVRVRSAIRATEHLDSMLSATQLGITLASLGLGWVGEPFVAHRLAPVLEKIGITDPAEITGISFAVAFALITFLHIVFGELAPKSLAIQYPKKTSLAVALPLMIFHKLLFPFIWALNGTANFFLRKIGIHPAGEGAHGFSPEEMEYVLSHSRHTHSADILVNRLMLRSLRLRDTRVSEIMLPRDEINALWSNAAPQENLRIAQSTGHSRYPVFDGDLDKPVGILMMREWLWQIQVLGKDTPIKPLLREMLTFPPEMPIADVLERLRLSQNHLALVVNDEGRTLGLISFEDVLEEIVGDIRDEFDTDQKEIFEQTPDSIVVAGTLSMHELEAETGWSLEWEGNSTRTVAEWIKFEHGFRVPKRGEKLRIADYEIIPLETPAGSLKRLLITRKWETEHPVEQTQEEAESEE